MSYQNSRLMERETIGRKVKPPRTPNIIEAPVSEETAPTGETNPEQSTIKPEENGTLLPLVSTPEGEIKTATPPEKKPETGKKADSKKADFVPEG
jgi:hypothetical protein